MRAAAAAGIAVTTIAGPSAVTAALAVAGLPTDRFVFEGFLPAGRGERQAAMTRLAQEPRTLVLFEAPHRIAATLGELAEAFGGERAAVVARELTKVYETIYRGTLAELAARAGHDTDLARGEITLVIAGATGEGGGDAALLARALPLLLRDLPPARAAAIAAQLSGVPRSLAYEHARRLARDNGAEPRLDPVSSRGGEPARQSLLRKGWRKVRAQRVEVPGNAWGARAHGKCNRKQTAEVPATALARVKGCGKSAPRRW